MMFLLSKCYTSNLDIIADQDQNVTHPPQFEVIINGICKWYSCLDNFFPALATLVFVAIATFFLICSTENDVHFTVFILT